MAIIVYRWGLLKITQSTFHLLSPFSFILPIITNIIHPFGDRGGTAVKVLCYKSESRWFDPSWCQWHKILLIALWPWGRLNPWQKWVPGTFPGGKGSRCVRLTTLPPSCAVVMKSGNLNFLEPSGPLQACDGTALPLPFTHPFKS